MSVETHHMNIYIYTYMYGYKYSCVSLQTCRDTHCRDSITNEELKNDRIQSRLFDVPIKGFLGVRLE